jgi:hypothetical protein
MMRTSAAHFSFQSGFPFSLRAIEAVCPSFPSQSRMRFPTLFCFFGGDGRTLEANVGWRELDWRNVKTDLAKDVQIRNRR